MTYFIEECNLKVKSDLIRKAVNIKTLLEFGNTGISKAREYEVDYILRLSKEDYESFTNNLLYDFDFIKDMCELTDKEFIVTIDSNDVFVDGGILVAHEGYTYARYSGLILEVI